MAEEQAVAPHDALFKQLMGDPATVATFLGEHLPSEVAALLAPDLPVLVAGSFVDEHLAQHHSDLLFEVALQGQDGGRRTALAFVLLEHNAAPDVLTPLQLLRYLVRIWHDWLARERGLPLPPVFCLVVYHGPRGWSVSQQFQDLFGDLPGALKPFLPSFKHGLVDLGRIPDEALSRDARLLTYLKVMKYALRPELVERLEELLTAVLQLGRVEIEQLLIYIGASPMRIGVERLVEAIDAVSAARGGDGMGVLEVLEKRALERGRTEGKAEGKAEGEAQGKAKTLLRLLSLRFGKLPAHARKRIAAADDRTLDRWIDRVLDATDLKTLLDG